MPVEQAGSSVGEGRGESAEAVAARSLSAQLMARLQTPQMQAMMQDPAVLAQLRAMMQDETVVRQAASLMRDPAALWSALQHASRPQELRDRLLDGAVPPRNPSATASPHAAAGGLPAAAAAATKPNVDVPAPRPAGAVMPARQSSKDEL